MITDSREMKDSNGNQIGRQFLVLRKDYGQKGTWMPFEKLIHCRKQLKSFYNKHPELPYPNCLAQNEDEEFEPGSKNGGKKAKQAYEASKDKKPKGRPPQNQARSLPLQPNHIQQAKPNPPQKIINNGNQVAEDEPLPVSSMRVEGLFVDAKTDEIIYLISSKGKQFYQNRKWVIINCKLELIDFYERCMRFKDK